MKEPLVSIIIPCKNEGQNIRHTINSIRENSGNIPYEIIVVDDGSGDGCCNYLRNTEETLVTLITTPGVHGNRARNIGAENARGDIFIFCDAHIFVEKDWLEKLTGALTKPGIDAVSPGIKPHDSEGPAWGGLTWEDNMVMKWLLTSQGYTPMPVLPRCCLAVTRKAFEAVGGFENGFRVYGFEDVEFTLKLWLFGFGAYINPEVTIRHVFRTVLPYPVKSADIDYNLLRLAFLHFNQSRLGKVMAILKKKAYFEEIYSEVIISDAPERRGAYLAQRVYDDDWFIQKFNIPF